MMLSKENIKDIYALSPLQAGMFFHALYEPSSPAYFEQMSYRFRGELNISYVEKSLNELMKRYDILRTVFIQKAAHEPLQVVLKERNIDFRFHDISGRQDKENYLNNYKAEDRKNLFDLGKDVLMRVTLIRRDKENYEFIWSFHHIVMDGWCTGILVSDFFEIYNGFRENRPFRLPPVIPYRVYIDWLEKQDKEEAKNYWQKYLENYQTSAGVPRLKTLNTKKSSYKKGQLLFQLEREKTAALEKLAGQNNVTLNILFQAVWGIILCKYNDKQDVVFGTVVSGRPTKIKRVETMVGLFINTVPVRIKFEDNTSFSQLLQDTQEEAVRGAPFHYTQLAEIQAQSPLKQNLLDHILVFENYPLANRIAGSNHTSTDRGKITAIEVARIDSFEQTNYNFNLLIGPEEQLTLNFDYNANAYDDAFIKRTARHLNNLLEQILKVEPEELTIDKITLLSHEERKQLLVDFNDTASPYPRNKTIPGLFAEQVSKRPDHIALIGPISTVGPITISYKKLAETSGQLARLLRAKGVKLDTIVGIMVERGVEMIIGILAILKAGGAYLPIDPQYPEERIKYMLADSNARTLITARNLSEGIVFEKELIYFEDYKEKEGIHHSSFITHHSGHLAYIMYTSGSTGKPKGTLTTHYNVIRVVKKTNYIDLGKSDRVLQLSNYAFDGSVFDIYGALLNGAALVMIKQQDILSIDTLSTVILRQEVTVFFITTALFNTLVDMGIESLRSVGKILFGGERVSVEHAGKAMAYLGKGRLIHVYGPTETTVYATYHFIDRVETDCLTIPIGKPISNTSVYIVDRNSEPVPVGAVGELLIGGDGVARGYLNRPELTAEKFDQDFQDDQDDHDEKEKAEGFFHSSLFTHHSALYRTGDLVRWLPDGSIEFIGRIDLQVKLRGYRVEMGEIENHLLKHPRIKEAVVTVSESSTGHRYLCAYFVSAGTVDKSALKDQLSQSLPDYMIPSYFMQLKNMPLTPNGKVDRKALPEPKVESGKKYTAPCTRTEIKLTEIWSQVLEIKKNIINVHADFFDLGGHSLKAAILTSLIHKELNVKVPLAEIFNARTIRRLSEYISHTAVDKRDEFASVEPVEKKEYYALSSAQKRLYFLHQLEPETTAYNIPLVLPLGENIDKDRLESALKKLVARHESLRTSFEMVNNEAVQKVHQEVEFEIACYDFVNEVDRPFDLSQAPLLRSGLVKLPDNHYLWVVHMHHIISDGTSMSVLVEDFPVLYSGQPLPQLRLQYKDFAAWQNRLFESGRIKQQESYWLDLYKDGEEIPRLQLLADHKRPPVFNFAGDNYHFILAKEEAVKFKHLASQCGATLYMNLLAALNTLFYKYTGQEDIIIGSGIAGRHHADLQRTIGMFVNTLAMRNFPMGWKTYEAFLEEVVANSIKAFENQDVQFEALMDKIGLHRDPSRNPLFDIAVVVQNLGQAEQLPIPGETPSPADYKNTTSKFDMTFFVQEIGEDVFINIEYYTAIFEQGTIQRLASHLKNVVVTAAADPSVKLKDIDILSPDEKKKVLFEFNDTASPYPMDKTIHQLFEEQVLKTPAYIALIGPIGHMSHISLSYKELDKKSGQLAQLLRKKGVKVGTIVGIMAARSVEMVIGVLAILKAGGAYLPIDPEYPEERINYMLADSGTTILLTNLPGGHHFNFNCELSIVNCQLSMNIASDLPTRLTHPTDLSYIIYTSGTTGKPRGVMIEHRSLVNLCFWHNRYYDVRESDNAAQYAAFSFDASVWEIFPYLIKGASLHIISDSVKLDIEELNRYYEKNHITVGFLPTQVCEQFTAIKNQSLRKLLTGGDKLNTFIKRGYDLYNNYGPTENTVVSTSCIVARNYDNIPIGKPIANTRIYILDQYKNFQPIGVKGELCISGGNVARGYLNNPELTAEKFDQDLQDYQDKKEKVEGFHHSSLFTHHSSLYRTGDLARWLPDGNIEFLGRKDFQVKVRGFRIETGEIETQLMNHENIKAAVVTVREDDTGDRYLCAYFVPANDASSLSRPLLREHLSRQLPEYMIPSYFVPLEKMPLETNGKVDRRALPDPVGIGLSSGVPYVPPQNGMEEKIVGIWADVLKRDAHTIGIHDNFFELGGNSINILKIAARIHDELKLDVSVSVLFLHPTVREIAASIHEQGILSRLECVVKLNKGKNKKNIFILHPYHGMVYPYKELARLLEDDYTVYGIQARGLIRDSRLPETSQMMVADYIHQLRQVQEEGPFIIAGFCFGSIVAYEMVNQLETMNCPVEQLILLDEHAFIPESFVRYIQSRRPKARNLLNRLLGVVGKGSVGTGVRDYVREVNTARGSNESRRLPEEMELRKERVEENNKKLERRGFSISGIIKAPLLDIKAEASKGPQFEMKSLCKMSEEEVTIIEVPGDHDTIFSQPYVRKLAEIIKNMNQAKTINKGKSQQKA